MFLVFVEKFVALMELLLCDYDEFEKFNLLCQIKCSRTLVVFNRSFMKNVQWIMRLKTTSVQRKMVLILQLEVSPFQLNPITRDFGYKPHIDEKCWSKVN